VNIAEASDRELAILENIYHSSRGTARSLKQRDLAHIAGISLGMTNSIVKRLGQKGWVVIRRINSRNIQYAVSAAGIDEITRRSYRFLKRTIKNIVIYRDTLERFVWNIQGRGFHGIILVGQTDLDFILEHVCGKCRLDLVRADSLQKHDGYFTLVSRAHVPRGVGERGSEEGKTAFLDDILLDL
jgi:DNA-binding MarR family transcriptional regulator